MTAAIMQMNLSNPGEAVPGSIGLLSYRYLIPRVFGLEVVNLNNSLSVLVHVRLLRNAVGACRAACLPPCMVDWVRMF